VELEGLTMPKAKVLIFIVAYNAESTIQAVLSRIPREVLEMNYEILIIDDQSKDKTFEAAEAFRKAHGTYNLTVLFNPVNQGYGGNQKIGYEYAVRNGFDAVALVHGDGQYAPEALPQLLAPILNDQADAVFGSRMLTKDGARKGGMPLYKFVGNKILTYIQNRLLHSKLSEFHSGYRVYSVAVLKQIPFQYNTDDFHFDTEIIIQFMMKRFRILELPIPTYYGDEICHVNGIAYAANVIKTTVAARLHDMEIFYRRSFDVHPPETRYRLKLGYVSSHSLSIDEIAPNSKVLDIGCGQGLWAGELKRSKNCAVTGIDAIADPMSPALVHYEIKDLNNGSFQFDTGAFDYVVLLDLIEHLDSPAQRRILSSIRDNAVSRKPKVIFTTPNVAFVITRLMLLLGWFNYGRRGILDYTHRHLFTFKSFQTLLQQAGYTIHRQRGIPPPYPEALGDNFFSRMMLQIHGVATRLFPGLFAYQIYVVASPRETVEQLLNTAISRSADRRAAQMTTQTERSNAT
jgi:glycosyltransferase involved in cell wall biosynthesis